MNGNGELPKLPKMLGKAVDLYMRQEPFNEDNERRGKTVDKTTWYDKGIVVQLPFNAAFQNAREQVAHFYEEFKKIFVKQRYQESFD